MKAEEAKQLIKSAMASSTTKMTIRELIKTFKELTGKEIPFRQFGFLDLETYLKSLSDILIVSGTGSYAYVLPILTSGSAHIANMIQHQKKSTSSHVRKPRNTHIFTHTTRKTTNLFNPNRKTPLKEGSIRPFSTNKSFMKKPVSLPSTPFTNASSPSKRKFPPKQMNQTISTHLQKNNSKSPLPRNVFSQQSTMKASTPKTTRWSPPADQNKRQMQNGGFHVPVSEEKSFVCELTFDHSMNYKVPYNVQENLKNLMAENAEGIWLIKLRDMYKQTYNEELDYSSYGYKTLPEMCLALPYVFNYKDYRTCGTKLYIANQEIPKEDIELMKAIEDGSSKVRSPETPTVRQPVAFSPKVSQTYPPFVLQPGESIPLVKMPEVADYAEIRIAEIYDLSKFWFTLDCYENNLQTLNRELDEFYGNGDKLKIPASLVEPGMFCVLNRNHEYSRAIVVKFIDDNVKVFCVDFGTVVTTTYKNLHFLHKEFAALPRQGLRGSLSGIRPPVKNDQWCRDGAYRFVQLVQNRILFAGINAVVTSLDDPIYEIVLCDSTHDADIFIQDVLVKEGFAVVHTQEQRDGGESLFDGYVPNVDELHLYPTFRELEQAMVPNAVEMRNLVALKIPLYRIYPQYFEKTLKERERIKLKEQNVTNMKSDESSISNNICSLPMRRSLFESPGDINSPIRKRMNALASSLSAKEVVQNGDGLVNCVNEDEVEGLFKRVLISPPPCPQFITPKSVILNPRIIPMHTQRMPAGIIHPPNPFVSQPRFMNNINTLNNGFTPKLENPSEENIRSDFSFLKFNANGLELEQPSHSKQSFRLNQCFDDNTTALLEIEKNMQKRGKKFVVRLTINGNVIHVVRYMHHGCFLADQVMNAFKCKQDLNCIRRFLTLSGITLLTIQLADVDESLRQELIANKLVQANQTFVECASLSDLQEFISIIINDDYEIPQFQEIVAEHKGSSKVWHC